MPETINPAATEPAANPEEEIQVKFIEDLRVLKI
jgi:hypothetical protein